MNAPAHRSRIVPPPASPEQQRRNEIPLQIQVPSPLLTDLHTMRARVRRRVSGDCTFELCLLIGDGTISHFYRAPIPHFFSNNLQLNDRNGPNESRGVSNCGPQFASASRKQDLFTPKRDEGCKAKKLPGTVKTKEEVVTMPGEGMQALEC